MFYKDRDIPFKLKAGEAIMRRLPSQHPKLPLIEEDHRKNLAGVRGEKALDYQLTFLPINKYIIINDLRLQQGDHFFQIDSLLISPQLSFIIDAKNIAGTVIFDHNFNQCIRIFNEKEEGIRDPFTQVQRNARQLSQWLADHKLPDLKLEYLIALSNSSTIIKSQGTNPHKNMRVVHAAHLIERIRELEKRNPNEIIDEKDAKRIAKQLGKLHVPARPNLLDVHTIHPEEIKPGVQCPNCLSLPMDKVHGTWHCPTCKITSKDVHISALSDYYYLYGSIITLSQFSDFLSLPKSKRKSASNILIALNLPNTGKKKGESTTSPL